MTTATAPTQWAARLGYDALRAAGLSDGTTATDRGSRLVSSPDARPVWMTANVLASDERIVVRWTTTNQVEAASSVSVRLDRNAAAFLSALAAVRVDV